MIQNETEIQVHYLYVEYVLIHKLNNRLMYLIQKSKSNLIHYTSTYHSNFLIINSRRRNIPFADASVAYPIPPNKYKLSDESIHVTADSLDPGRLFSCGIPFSP